ncbi:YceI family protein [Massilia phyllosphaerae]|uniref:YceI family protein n=1 Tax=Massilia phyllosphaerae TaxID=3106034 RepID=UPI0035C936E5
MFNVASYPQAEFVAADLKRLADQVKRVTGQMTLVGKANPVILTAAYFKCY